MEGNPAAAIKKLQMHTPFDPVIPLLGIGPTYIIVHMKTTYF